MKNVSETVHVPMRARLEQHSLPSFLKDYLPLALRKVKDGKGIRRTEAGRDPYPMTQPPKVRNSSSQRTSAVMLQDIYLIVVALVKLALAAAVLPPPTKLADPAFFSNNFQNFKLSSAAAVASI